MKKLSFALFIAVLVAAGLTPAAQAVTPKTLVIIDSGIAADLPWVKEILVDEACFIEYGRCPNGLSTMSGKGSAALPVVTIKDKAMSHGTQMASVAYQIDPTTKLVVIRIVGMSNKGYANTYTTRAVTKALTWVNAIADRLNVGAVSLSIGRSYKEATCPIEFELQTQVRNLAARDIPVVAATGNGSNRFKVDYPACVPEVIAIGATDTRYSMRNIQGWVYPIMLISNQGPDLDFYTLGRYATTNIYDVKEINLGTSSATVAFASYLVSEENKGQDYQSVMNYVRSNLNNAFRTVTEFYPLQFTIEK